ncbi:cation diffusion facilitator family transporter [uncultured Campylobacter sp.]|uniref:cation diffusion facilitator family transporter n=1 Tax=uncultured Campylobacter sp. TaxID=218934 RepID=UPI0015B2CD7F|nr:cation diffusion facilitator family transporter [uncultured Campylobacter sp.]
MEVPQAAYSRDKIIVRTGAIGIISNVILAAFKGVVGLISGSIAIVLDAVNNLSDALSSVITIVGVHLASKQPDRAHPFGHGRIEYLSAIVIAVIILYTGGVSLVESIKKIIHPQAANYNVVSLAIIAVAVAAKFSLGLYTQKTGERVNSDSLIASGVDAKYDALVSLATLVAALISLIFRLSLEAYLGAIISALLIKTAYEILRDTISKLLGSRPSLELTNEIYDVVRGFEGVIGAYDLMFHDYGPDKMVGSIHIEVAEGTTAAQIDALTRRIQNAVFAKFNIILDTVGIYAFNKNDPRAAEIREHIKQMALSHEFVSQIHGFYLDEEKRSISFDVIVDFAAPDMEATFRAVCKQVRAAYPNYTLIITRDSDYSG